MSQITTAVLFATGLGEELNILLPPWPRVWTSNLMVEAHRVILTLPLLSFMLKDGAIWPNLLPVHKETGLPLISKYHILSRIAPKGLILTRGKTGEDRKSPSSVFGSMSLNELIAPPHGIVSSTPLSLSFRVKMKLIQIALTGPLALSSALAQPALPWSPPGPDDGM
jgi:hypothetical protein